MNTVVEFHNMTSETHSIFKLNEPLKGFFDGSLSVKIAKHFNQSCTGVNILSLRSQFFPDVNVNRKILPKTVNILVTNFPKFTRNPKK